MSAALISESLIPKKTARAFRLLRGQVLRIIAVEGKQVGDLYLLNTDDPRERFSAVFSAAANDRSTRKASALFSGPPYFRPMVLIENDAHGVHWLGGRCNAPLYESMGAPGHANCHDNIVAALAPLGIQAHEIPIDTFNIFMNVQYSDDGSFHFRPPVIERGDFVDFRATINLTVAVSACPNEGELRGEINDGIAKSLKIEIYQG